MNAIECDLNEVMEMQTEMPMQAFLPENGVWRNMDGNEFQKETVKLECG